MPRRVKKRVVSRGLELSPQKRLEMIERVVKYNEPVTKVCIDFHISRPAFYKWLKRFQAAPEDKKLEALQDKKPEVERYYRQTPEKYEEAVLSVVAQYPQFGVARIVEVLPRIAGKPIVGYHGVQNVLRRYDLNTYEKRLIYARSQITSVVQLVSGLQGIFAKLFVLPPETRKKLVRLVTTSALTCFLTVVGLGAIGYFGTLLGETTDVGSRLGFVFASIALVAGSIFFAYSMKYYLTLALVLSFSHQTPEEGGGYQVGLTARFNGSEQGMIGWLKRIFGQNGNGGVKPLDKLGATPQAGGLQPNLDHIKLRRYPFFSIHLPFYNEKKVAQRILKACTSFDYPNYEVIVCDDSTDETVEIVQTFANNHNKSHSNGFKTKVIHRPTREGFKGGALKAALRAMDPKTEFVVVFDADFIPYPDTLEQFLKYFKATGGWEEKQNYQAGGVETMPYESFSKVKINPSQRELLDDQAKLLQKKSQIACVAGYQWHVLNKSENWVTRGVRTEYAGSYVIERPGQEILGALKIIHGSVYCIRADVLKHFGWGVSITEDYELTLRIYAQGFKVAFTPYIQAPSECVSTLKRLIRQRMRWAEGHSFNVKKMFLKLLFNPYLSWIEKLEFLYISPYYLQAFFFLVGTFSWLLSETVFKVRLPFWTSLWGWSLVLTNFFALPLMNAVGLFLEEAEEKDYLGLLSFVALSYLLVPFQAYASVKGFLESSEGPWFRTPKTGKITDIFTRGKFYRWILGILPGRKPEIAPISLGSSSFTPVLNPYLALATANNRFANFQIRPKRLRWVSKAFLAILLAFTVSLYHLSFNVSETYAAMNQATQYTSATASTQITSSVSWQLTESLSTDCTDGTNCPEVRGKGGGYIQWKPGVLNNSAAGTPGTPTNTGWVLDGDAAGVAIATGAWTFKICTTGIDADGDADGYFRAIIWKVAVSGGSIVTSPAPTQILDYYDGTTDIWDNTTTYWTFTTGSITGFTFDSQNHLYVEYWVNGGTTQDATDETHLRVTGGEACGSGNDTLIITPTVTVPEFLLVFLPLIPLIPFLVKKFRFKLATRGAK